MSGLRGLQSKEMRVGGLKSAYFRVAWATEARIAGLGTSWYRCQSWGNYIVHMSGLGHKSLILVYSPVSFVVIC